MENVENFVQMGVNESSSYIIVTSTLVDYLVLGSFLRWQSGLSVFILFR